MSLEAFIALYLGGLASCYWAGLKFGYVVRLFKNLGTSA